MSYVQKVHKIVKQIPVGKVATYGQISRILNSKFKISNYKVTPNMVGWALHANKDPQNIPCHRVVNKEGRLAPGYAFGGEGEQKIKLLKEGVKFKNDSHVDFSCLWNLPKKVV